jgi:muconolactone D-isomerase
MLFHVGITVRIPHDADPGEIKRLSAREHERAKELQLQHKWLHLWRVAGKYANISVFDVDSPAGLHEILNSLGTASCTTRTIPIQLSIIPGPSRPG